MQLVPTFIKKSNTFFSVKETENYLQSKKIVYKEKPELLPDRRWKIATIAVTLFSLLGATIALLDISNRKATLDHSHDNVTAYQFVEGLYNNPLSSYDHYLPNKDYFWVDHTLDKWVPNLSEGLKAGIPVAIVPLLLVFIVWKTYRIGSNILGNEEKNKVLEHNQKIDDLIITLLVSHPDLEDAELPPKFIKKLMHYDFSSSDLLKNLSFAQARSIRATNKVLFDQLLSDNSFSEVLKQYFTRLKLMLEATDMELGRALTNSQNNKIFENEPFFLEALIQELKTELFTELIQDLLATKLRLVNDKLDKLEKDQLKEIVKLIHKKKYSIKKAYHVCELNLLKNDKEIRFKTVRNGKTEYSIPISFNLFCNSSNTFSEALKDQLIGSELETPQINSMHLNNLNPALEYLKNNTLDCKQADILDILDVANFYHFEKLHRHIEKKFSKDLNSYMEDHELQDVLEMAKNYNLNIFKRMIDLKLSQKRPEVFSDDFNELLRLSTEFKLTEVFASCSKMICSNIEDLSQDEKFISNLVNVLKINQELFESIFISFKSLLATKPLLLKKIWDKAVDDNLNIILDMIEIFNKNPENLHIFLANWALPPSREKKDYILNSMELKEYI